MQFVKLQLGVQLHGGALVVFSREVVQDLATANRSLISSLLDTSTAAQICEDISNLYRRAKIRC